MNKTMERLAEDAAGEVLHTPFNSTIFSGAEDQFDLAIVDPPYNIGKDFGECKDNMAMAGYLKFMRDTIGRCQELVHKDGLVYVYGFSETLARVAAEQPWDKQRWLVWHYQNKPVPGLKFWQRSHESILALWKGKKKPALEIDAIREPYSENMLAKIGTSHKRSNSRFGETCSEFKDMGGALPNDVIKVQALSGGRGIEERRGLCRKTGRLLKSGQWDESDDVVKHPTQKPRGITEKLINSVPRKTGWVLVPFAGSGSECVVAKRMGRDFLATEVNYDYVELANAWLAAEQEPML